MRVVITGGSGFVGRHLAKALIARDNEVVLIARGVDRRDLSAFEIPNARFFQADLSSADELGAPSLRAAVWRIAQVSIARLKARLTNESTWTERVMWSRHAAGAALESSHC
jgi:nucleoside-diphosphate-sugar epimerase